MYRAEDTNLSSYFDALHILDGALEAVQEGRNGIAIDFLTEKEAKRMFWRLLRAMKAYSVQKESAKYAYLRVRSVVREDDKFVLRVVDNSELPEMRVI
jgi:hypothetical protein